jgi:hypothetical protein
MKKINNKSSGIILWEGLSVLDGLTPIACIATLKSNNVKTGNMVQTWIIRTDLGPVEASQAKQDSPICGACPHRQSLGGACYVNIGQAPLAVYRAYKRGSYSDLAETGQLDRLKGRAIRCGSYGDPAAIPANVWDRVAKVASHTTGYTHQTNHPRFDPAVLRHVMVSADTPKQAAKAQKAGQRTFRVKTEDAPMLENEIECLSDSQGLNCIDCGMCDSATNDKPSIVINVHGSRSKRYTEKYERINMIAAA